jgi:hypothetical protein
MPLRTVAESVVTYNAVVANIAAMHPNTPATAIITFLLKSRSSTIRTDAAPMRTISGRRYARPSNWETPMPAVSSDITNSHRDAISSILTPVSVVAHGLNNPPPQPAAGTAAPQSRPECRRPFVGHASRVPGGWVPLAVGKSRTRRWKWVAHHGATGPICPSRCSTDVCM